MKDFVLKVARFLEEGDASLLPLKEEIPLYPCLKADLSSLRSTGGVYHDFTAFEDRDRPPPTNPELSNASAPLSSLAPSSSSSTLFTSTSAPSYSSSSSSVSSSSCSSSSPPPVVIVNNIQKEQKAFSNRVERVLIVPRTEEARVKICKEEENDDEEKKKEKKEDDSANRWIGAALIGTAAVASTVAISKMSLKQKVVHNLVEERKQFVFSAQGTAERAFLEQFDKTFAELVKCTSLSKSSIVGGGISAAMLGSFYFFGVGSGAAYFPFVITGVSSLAVAAYSHFYVGNKENTETKSLHQQCKRFFETE